MIEAIFLISALSVIYPFVGALIFRKVFYHIKAQEFAKGTYERRNWESETKNLWAFGCMVGAFFWPIASMGVAMYYILTHNQLTPFEKEEMLKELARKNDEMERELRIGKYAPIQDSIDAQLKRKQDIHRVVQKKSYGFN